MVIVRIDLSLWCIANSSYMTVIITTAFYLHSFALKYTHFFKSSQNVEALSSPFIYMETGTGSVLDLKWGAWNWALPSHHSVF